MKKSKPDKEALDAMIRDTNNWKNLVYINKEDPRLIVPKKDSSGWTFNFANRYSYIILVLIIAIVVLIAALTT
jgi:uncharacterized membrane protein